MVETILTPPHPDSLEALLDKPFTGTFHHPRAQGAPVAGVQKTTIHTFTAKGGEENKGLRPPHAVDENP